MTTFASSCEHPYVRQPAGSGCGAETGSCCASGGKLSARSRNGAPAIWTKLRWAVRANPRI
jgi:hypothetical protein